MTKKILMPVMIFLIGLPLLASASEPTKEDQALMKANREEQYQANRVKSEEAHAKYIASLKEKLAKNKKLTDAQKNDIINFYEEQHRQNVDFLNTQHSENIAFFDKLNSDAAMTEGRRKAAVKAFFKQQRKDVRDHHRQQQRENREEVKKIRQEVKDNSKQKGG